jgi:hypothetical protein
MLNSLPFKPRSFSNESRRALAMAFWSSLPRQHRSALAVIIHSPRNQTHLFIKYMQNTIGMM